MKWSAENRGWSTDELDELEKPDDIDFILDNTQSQTYQGIQLQLVVHEMDELESKVENESDRRQ